MLNSSSLLVRLAVLLGVLLVQSCEGQSWATFKKKHIDYPKTSAPNLNAYCNLMMVQRKLDPTMCKVTNTFINNATDSVQDVCGNGGKQFKDKFYDSNNPFSMTICRFIYGKPPNDCKYKGTQSSRRIRVTCENKKPVHLEKLL